MSLPSSRRPLARALQIAAILLGVTLCLCAGFGRGHAAPPSSGVLSGQVDLKGADPTEVGVVVYLEPAVAPKAKPSASPTGTFRIVQRGKQFSPRMMVVPVGSTIEFPNEDHIFHNVFSLSSTERFDLGLYKSGKSKSVTFKRPGAVDVYCNIHPEMAAQVLVLDTAHYAIVDKTGKFRIADVPAGDYTMVVWQRYQEPLRQKLTITAGRTKEQRVSMEAGSRPRRHLRKDGEPYGRYR
jgi:plastocyanin